MIQLSRELPSDVPCFFPDAKMNLARHIVPANFLADRVDGREGDFRRGPSGRAKRSAALGEDRQSVM